MTTLAFRQLGLRPAQLKELDKKAKHEGKTTAEYVRWLIERELLADKSFDEILTPIRDDFKKSGITEDKLDALVDRARTATYRQKRKARR